MDNTFQFVGNSSRPQYTGFSDLLASDSPQLPAQQIDVLYPSNVREPEQLHTGLTPTLTLPIRNTPQRLAKTTAKSNILGRQENRDGFGPKRISDVAIRSVSSFAGGTPGFESIQPFKRTGFNLRPTPNRNSNSVVEVNDSPISLDRQPLNLQVTRKRKASALRSVVEDKVDDETGTDDSVQDQKPRSKSRLRRKSTRNTKDKQLPAESATEPRVEEDEKKIPRRGPVIEELWEFFKRTDGRVHCTFIDNNGEECAWSNKLQKELRAPTSNMWKHLKSKHGMDKDAVVAEGRARIMVKGTSQKTSAGVAVERDLSKVWIFSLCGDLLISIVHVCGYQPSARACMEHDGFAVQSN